MKKLALLAAGVIAGTVAFAAPVLADSPGQLSNGPTNYKVRNVTQNGAYAQSVSAACNETVKYSVTLANSDYGMLTDLTLKANLTSGDINASAKNVNGDTTSVAGKATVSVPANASLGYVAGSTVRINGDNTQQTNLADGVAGNGVNVGSLNGSTYIFVQFQAKVNCQAPPKQITVCRLADKTIVVINEKDFDSSKYSKDLNDCKTVPPKKITVCRLADKTIVVINESDFNSDKYSKDLNDCKTAPPAKITVCRLADKTIVTINEKDFDSSKYSKNLNDCKQTPPKQIQVCELSTKTIVTINESDFNSDKYSTDLNDCKTAPVPPELPKTGPGQMLGVFAAVTAAGAVAHRLFARRFGRG